MVGAHFVRKLNLTAPLEVGRPPHLCSASSLILHQGYLYTISDDELSLVRFLADPKSPLETMPLFDGVLPIQKEARKQAKPDFEALVMSTAGLLVIPSGSKFNRTLGARILDPSSPLAPCTGVDWSLAFDKLQQEVNKAGGAAGDLNIEGAVITEEKLLLFQRGNGVARFNAILEFDLARVLDSIVSRGFVTEAAFLRCISYDLGSIHGFPLGFSDAVVLPDGQVAFTAIAEGSASTVEDGELLGSVLGILNPRTHQVVQTDTIEANSKPAKIKPEGICLVNPESTKEFYLVTDADDSEIPSSLFKISLN